VVALVGALGRVLSGTRWDSEVHTLSAMETMGAVDTAVLANSSFAGRKNHEYFARGLSAWPHYWSDRQINGH
jgi:hypothetical protein